MLGLFPAHVAPADRGPFLWYDRLDTPRLVRGVARVACRRARRWHRTARSGFLDDHQVMTVLVQDLLSKVHLRVHGIHRSDGTAQVSIGQQLRRCRDFVVFCLDGHLGQHATAAMLGQAQQMQWFSVGPCPAHLFAVHRLALQDLTTLRRDCPLFSSLRRQILRVTGQALLQHQDVQVPQRASQSRLAGHRCSRWPQSLMQLCRVQADPMGHGMPAFLPARQRRAHQCQQQQPRIPLPASLPRIGNALENIQRCATLLVVHRVRSFLFADRRYCTRWTTIRTGPCPPICALSKSTNLFTTPCSPAEGNPPDQPGSATEFDVALCVNGSNSQFG